MTRWLLVLCISLMLLACKPNHKGECLSKEDVYLVDGIVKKAGAGYYVFSDRWKFIINTCMEGRGAATCHKKNPGIVVLEENIGKPVSVEYCGDKAITYYLADVQYKIQ
jgi:hypothetical protein